MSLESSWKRKFGYYLAYPCMQLRDIHKQKIMGFFKIYICTNIKHRNGGINNSINYHHATQELWVLVSFFSGTRTPAMATAKLGYRSCIFPSTGNSFCIQKIKTNKHNHYEMYQNQSFCIIET
jgi:hypothetical protein